MKAREYQELVDIRFADLDFYGHVNSAHYLDLVGTARLSYMANQMKTPIQSVTERGIGFFLVKSTISYKRPINGLQKVRVQSRVTEMRDLKILPVAFEMLSMDGSIHHSDGVLEYAVIDLATKKLTVAPQWVLDLFFEP